MKSVAPVKIIKVDQSSVEEKDLVAIEEPLEIKLQYGPTEQRKEIDLTARNVGLHNYHQCPEQRSPLLSKWEEI